MLSASDKEQFARDGFLLVPNVLAAKDVASLRRALTLIFDEPAAFEGDRDNGTRSWQRGQFGAIRLDICARYPELRWLLAHPPLVNSLRALLGDDFTYLPEMSAHRSGFGNWHKDTTSQERAGKKFHWASDFLMVEAALYLQPNDPEYGGGLDVIPGSHLQPDTYRHNVDADFLARTKNKLKQWGVLPAMKGYSIPSKPGDLVLFHLRLDHRATWPAVKSAPPPEKEKLAIFFACSKNNHHAKSYVEYIGTRPDYQYLQNHHYPDELMQLARSHKLSLTTRQG